jgi:hypothetical protein
MLLAANSSLFLCMVSILYSIQGAFKGLVLFAAAI